MAHEAELCDKNRTNTHKNGGPYYLRFFMFLTKKTFEQIYTHIGIQFLFNIGNNNYSMEAYQKKK